MSLLKIYQDMIGEKMSDLGEKGDGGTYLVGFNPVEGQIADPHLPGEILHVDAQFFPGHADLVAHVHGPYDISKYEYIARKNFRYGIFYAEIYGF